MGEIEIELVPVREKKANGAKLGRYDAVLPDGRVLVRSRQPLFDGARKLLAEGVAPATLINTRHQGSAIVAMRSTVGEAAKWTVTERDRGGLPRELWKPYEDGHSPIAVLPKTGALGVAPIQAGSDIDERFFGAPGAEDEAAARPCVPRQAEAA